MPLFQPTTMVVKILLNPYQGLKPVLQGVRLAFTITLLVY